MNTYELGVVPIPTNKPVVRARPGRPHLQGRGRQVRRRRRRHRRAPRAGPAGPRRHGQRREERVPVAACCSQRGIAHEVLNAKQHTREAEIVAQAGRLGAVTVATNMAGRGVDILLGGNPEGLARHEVLKEGHAAERDGRRLRAAAAARPRCPRSSRRPRAKALARYDELLAEFKVAVPPRRATRSASSAACTCIGSERHESAPHRQPAAWPLRPPGRPRREPLLPQPRRRADAPVRHRRAVAT